MAQVKLNFLLMGKTGNGKSFTGNNLLGREHAFNVSSQFESVTKEVQQDFAHFENYILKVVDGPGLQDTAMDAGKDQETAAAKMAEALAFCDDHVSAFLFVYKYGTRFTNDEKDTLEGLKQIFGEKYYNHMIVVVTMGDLFRADMVYEGKGNISFLDWCRQQKGPVKQLFDDCRERFVLFNNRENDEDNMHKQRKEIIELANQVQKINGCYTSQAFQAAKAAREHYIVKRKLPILAGQIQEKCGLLTAQLEKYIKAPTEHDKLKIQESIKAVKAEIQEQDKGTNLLRELLRSVHNVEQSLDDIEQLNKLTKELNDTRKSKIAWTTFGSFCAGGGGLVSVVGGLSIATALLTFTMPPVALALAAGTTAVSAVATGINYVRSSNQEKKLKEEQDKTKSKLTKAGVGGNSTK